MNDTERYLKGATRGLWGKEKQALRTELTGHIRIRTTELMLNGLSENEAERQTLRELGAPAEVSRGMAGVYALQTAVKGTVMTSLLACAALLTIQQGQAQVTTVYDAPKANFGFTAYLDLMQLKQELQKGGGAIVGQEPNLILELPGTPRPSFPIYVDEYNAYTRGGKSYISALAFAVAVANTGADVQIQGWENPTLKADNWKIQLRSQDWRVINELYSLTLNSDSELGAWGTTPITNFAPNGAVKQVRVRNGAIRQGHLYALVVPRFGMWSMTSGGQKTSGTIELVTNAVQATQNGQAQFRAYTTTPPFKFVQNEETLHHALDPYRGKLGGWNVKNPAPALLLELTGKFGPDAYRVLPPSAWK